MSENGLDTLGGIFSLDGVRAGEAEGACMEGVRVLVKVSWRLDDRFDVLRIGMPGVILGFVPLTVPFSLVTSPLSCAN